MPKVSQSDGPPVPRALNLAALSRGGGGVGFLNEGGLGEAVRVSTRCECKFASAIELTESVRADTGRFGAKLEACWPTMGDTT